MGRIKKEDYDGFVGNVGPVTVTRWKETVVVKARQHGSTKPRSEKQQQASRRLGLLTRFFGVINPYITEGYRGSEKRNAQHAAISMNMHDGICGEWPEYRLCWERLRLTMADGGEEENRLGTAGMSGGVAKMDGREIEIEWRREGGGREDRVMLLVYNEVREEAIIETNVAARKDETVRILLPEIWGVGEEVHVYVCLVALGRASKTSYLGELRIGKRATVGEGYEGTIHTVSKTPRRERRKSRESRELSEEDKKHVSCVSGNVGPMTVYKYLGTPCIKVRHKTVQEPSAKKRLQNERFGNLTSFLKGTNVFLRKGYESESARMSQLNAAIKDNYRNAFGEGSAIAYDKIVLSRGGLQRPEKINVERDGSRLCIGWEGGVCQASVMIALYNVRLGESVVETSVGESMEMRAELTLPERWAGDELYGYMAFANGEDVSDSVSFVVWR